jgi:8-oxo-dGTP diphosphatase
MNDYNIDVIRKRYALVPRTLVFIQRENEYLLIHKKKRNSYGFGKMNGVGGHMEKGEDPFASARREVLEETGLSINQLDICAILFIDTEDTPGVEVFVFRADYEGGQITQSDEGRLEWKTLEEINSSDQILEDVPMLIDLCNQHEVGKIPQIIKYSYDEKGLLRIDNIMA